MSKLIKTTGKIIEVSPANGSDYTLEELKEYIGGGYIEYVSLPGDKALICDEEGKLKNLPVNSVASYEYGRYLLGDIICGDVVIINKNELK